MQADFSKNYKNQKFCHIFKCIWAGQKHTAFVINKSHEGKTTWDGLI
jgi:hypothetical protein